MDCIFFKIILKIRHVEPCNETVYVGILLAEYSLVHLSIYTPSSFVRQM